jgi:hypothetical protein
MHRLASMISLSLLILPATAPMIQGIISAARTASMSRNSPRARDAIGLWRVSESQGSNKSASRFVSVAPYRKCRSQSDRAGNDRCKAHRASPVKNSQLIGLMQVLHRRPTFISTSDLASVTFGPICARSSAAFSTTRNSSSGADPARLRPSSPRQAMNGSITGLLSSGSRTLMDTTLACFAG